MSASFLWFQLIRVVESRTCETCVIERAYGAQDLFDAWAEAANTRQTVLLQIW